MNKQLENQVAENTADIQHIKTSIDTIKNNHLHHIEKDMAAQSKTIEKMDNRLWWVLGLMVLSIVVATIAKGFGV